MLDICFIRLYDRKQIDCIQENPYERIPFWTLFFCSAAFGGIIGAYFGTAEYRIRCHMPLITGKCYCPLCGHSLSLIHQIPVVSWLFLRGRCHYCSGPVPIRYPLTESGFLVYYGFTFCALWGHPLLTLVSWFGLVCLLLLWRCQGQFLSAVRAMAVFAGYHGIYGLVFSCICAATQPM
ncbi:MAG: prepilin peptidase [Hungatella sp.]|nr:prepilin peptidase [Hungatella sp.]